MLDGAPIVVVASGLDDASRNGKTGAMVQTWIIRSDIKPLDAAKSGGDSSICGDCIHRGTLVGGMMTARSCYVNLWQAPRNIYESYHRGIYSDTWDSETFRDLKVRLGSYGDPAAVPLWIWERVLRYAAGNTGYTHQWRRFPELAQWCMASCDSELDHAHAKLLGFRTFRVKKLAAPSLRREVTCGASEEMGHRTRCDLCMACGGKSAKAKADIVISVHGSRALQNNFTKRAA